MALGEWSLIRAGMSHDRRRFAPALGLLPNVAVVPHLDEFGERWVPRLRRPTDATVLLGIDTRTAAVWRPRIGWRVTGAGRVAVIRGAGATGAARRRSADGDRPAHGRPAVGQKGFTTMSHTITRRPTLPITASQIGRDEARMRSSSSGAISPYLASCFGSVVTPATARIRP